jgi:enoyl-CoA hydratase/carnithine racemase
MPPCIETSTAGRIARIALNRPEKRNALNAATCRALLDAFDRAQSDPAIGVILIGGNGPAFCAGMDLQEVLGADQRELADLHERLFTIVQRIRKPVIAAVHGAALAAGTGLAANAHIVVASADARFGLTEIRIGLWPVIVFRSVVRAIGERRATELSLTGRIFTAEEALQFGLVAEIAADPLARAFELAKTLSEFSPVATAAGLEYINRIRSLDWTAAEGIGRKIRSELMATEDFAEGVRAFLEKRTPSWPSLKRR